MLMCITRINEFQAAENKSDDLFAFLRSVLPHLTSSAGNISCEGLKSSDSDNQFVVIGKWLSIEDRKASIASFPKQGMQSAMSLFAEPPKGAYYSD